METFDYSAYYLKSYAFTKDNDLSSDNSATSCLGSSLSQNSSSIPDYYISTVLMNDGEKEEKSVSLFSIHTFTIKLTFRRLTFILL
jgi:hypothetical protein